MKQFFQNPKIKKIIDKFWIIVSGIVLASLFIGGSIYSYLRQHALNNAPCAYTIAYYKSTFYNPAGSSRESTFFYEVNGRNHTIITSATFNRWQELDNYLLVKYTAGNIKKEKESYGKLPEFMSGEETERQASECLAGIYMTQKYKYPQTEIRIESDVFGSKVALTYWAKCIYFHDGSVDTTKQKISNWMDLDTPKVIDSILVTASYSGVTGHDKYEVKDKLNIEGGSIEIVTKKDNMVTVHFEGAATKYNEIVALNETGDVLSASSSSGETKDADKVVKVYAEAFDKKGHFIVPPTSSGYSMSESFGKRVYYLGGIKYNEYGNVVVNDDED